MDDQPAACLTGARPPAERLVRVQRPPTNGEWLLAKIGQRRGPTRYSRSLLPTVEDLGHGWVILGQKTWRTGRLGLRSEVLRRAAALGYVTAIRSFENKGRSRWLWVQVVPLASEADTKEALRGLPDRLMRNRPAKVEVVHLAVVDAPAVLGISSAWAMEQVTRGGNGLHVAQMLGMCVGSTLLVLLASGYEDWSWEEVADTAGVLASRVITAQKTT